MLSSGPRGHSVLRAHNNGYVRHPGGQGTVERGVRIVTMHYIYRVVAHQAGQPDGQAKIVPAHVRQAFQAM